ncbi:MAG: hypothetical protein ABW224_13695 [Kibdelosporangium sp.]
MTRRACPGRSPGRSPDQPAATPAPIRTVVLGDPDAPGHVLTLRLRWLCPQPECRWPRGIPERTTLLYRDAYGTEIGRADVDVWRNPCGHHQLTTGLIAEAAALNATERTSAA